MKWLRYESDDDESISYYEIDEDGWARRQVDLRGADQRPVAATTLDEVLRIRDQGDLAVMRDYERKYGVLAEGCLDGWSDSDQVDEITAEEFDQVWVSARHTIEQRS